MAEARIPKEWVTTEVDLTGEYINGKAFKPSHWEAEGRPIIRIQNLTDPNKEPNRTTIEVEDRYIVSPHDILVSWSATLDAFIWKGEEAVLNQHIFKVVPNDTGISKAYLFYGLKQAIREMVLSEHLHGSTMKHINRKPFLAHPFPLPPLAEQKEIARQLDDLLARVDTLKTRLDTIPAILKRFRQSTLAAAVSGKLTEAWREENGEVEWLQCSFGDLIEESANGLAKRRGEKGEEVTVLRLADFKDARRVYGTERQIKLTEKEREKYLLSNGDLLAIRVNGSVDLAGLFILYSENKQQEAYCDHFIKFVVDKTCANPQYLTFVANEGEGRHYLRNSLSTSAGQNTINQKSIKALPISLPPIDEQTEIVRRVDELFAFADQIEQRVKDAQARVDKLTQSILAKAFRGELTAEWRAAHPALITDKNSAEALLERIKEDWKKLGPKKKHRKRWDK